MKKYVLGLIVLAALSTPVVTRALTIADMQAQIQSLLSIVMQLQQQLLTLSVNQTDSTQQPVSIIEIPAPANTGAQERRDCLSLNRTLSKGMSDRVTNGEVSELQKFLKRMGYFTYRDITGYYGSVTVAAVKKYQDFEGYKKPDGNINEIDIKYMSKTCTSDDVTDGGSYIKASVLKGAAPLTVVFTTNVISGYTSDEQIFIDFGDGNRQELKKDCTAGGFWGCDNQTLTLKHTYYNPGTYNASISSESKYFTELGEVIKVTADPSIPRALISPLRLLDNNYYDRVHLYDISDPAADVIHVNWNIMNSVDTSNMGMYIMLKGSGGEIIKSQKVDINSGYAKIDLTGVCNGLFGDALDADCSVLRNRIKKGKTKYSLEGVVYTPKNACLGFCPSGISVMQPNIVWRAFAADGPFMIRSTPTPIPQPAPKTIKEVEFLLSDQLNRKTFGRDITVRVTFTDDTVAITTVGNTAGCEVVDTSYTRLDLAKVSCYAAASGVEYVAWVDDNNILRVDRLNESARDGSITRTTLWELPVKGLSGKFGVVNNSQVATVLESIKGFLERLAQ